MSGLSLCIIAYNEEKTLGRCIGSLRGAYSDIVVSIDTRTTDKTEAIAKHYGANIIHHSWKEDFSAARNECFSAAREPWIIWMDCDDVFVGNTKDLVKLLDSCHDNVGGIWLKYIYSSLPGGAPELAINSMRIIRNRFGTWNGVVHELLALTRGIAISSPIPLEIHHLRVESSGRPGRNLRILENVIAKDNGEDTTRYMFYLGMEYYWVGRFKEAISTLSKYLDMGGWRAERHYAMCKIAECYRNLGDIPDMYKYCYMAIEFAPEYPESYFMLEDVAYAAKDWKSCVYWFERMKDANVVPSPLFDIVPNRTHVPNEYASIAYWNLKRFREGYECAKKCVSFYPEQQVYKNNLPWFTREVGDDEFKIRPANRISLVNTAP